MTTHNLKTWPDASALREQILPALVKACAGVHAGRTADPARVTSDEAAPSDLAKEIQ